jgi:hypothetical protein
MELAEDDVVDYTNDRYQMAPRLLKASGSDDVDPQAIMPVRDKLWESECIGRIIADNPLGLAGRELGLVGGWSRRVVGDIVSISRLFYPGELHKEQIKIIISIWERLS